MLPSEYLDAPYPEDVLPDAMDKLLHWTDFLSPSHDVMLIIQKLCGHNPLDEIATAVAGDWHAFGVAQAAVEQLREYFEALALEVHRVSTGLDAVWGGNAADAAVNSFETAADAIAAADSPLAQISGEMKALEIAVKRGADTLVTLEEAAIDKAIAAAIEAAAAGATSETVIGGIIFGSLSLYSAYEVVRTVRELKEAWDLLMKVVDRSSIVIFGLCGSLSAAVTIPMDLKAYHHPGVK